MSTTESAPTGSQPSPSAPPNPDPGTPGTPGPTVRAAATSAAVAAAAKVASTKMASAGPEVLTAADQERRRRLNRMKAIATGALVLMAVIFVIAFSLEDRYPWLGYI